MIEGHVVILPIIACTAEVVVEIAEAILVCRLHHGLEQRFGNRVGYESLCHRIGNDGHGVVARHAVVLLPGNGPHGQDARVAIVLQEGEHEVAHHVGAQEGNERRMVAVDIPEAQHTGKVAGRGAVHLGVRAAIASVHVAV